MPVLSQRPAEALTIWATSWENLFRPYANNKDADQPAQSDQCLCCSLLFTGRKASLSICTRAKEMLWIEAITGAWSWLSKWWRCWSVWWRDSSGKELRSMRCSVASCLAVALLMQFLLYVSYRRSTWLPTSRSTWPSSTWRKHLIEFHGMSSGGQCAN